MGRRAGRPGGGRRDPNDLQSPPLLSADRWHRPSPHRGQRRGRSARGSLAGERSGGGPVSRTYEYDRQATCSRPPYRGSNVANGWGQRAGMTLAGAGGQSGEPVSALEPPGVAQDSCGCRSRLRVVWAFSVAEPARRHTFSFLLPRHKSVHIGVQVGPFVLRGQPRQRPEPGRMASTGSRSGSERGPADRRPFTPLASRTGK